MIIKALGLLTQVSRSLSRLPAGGLMARKWTELDGNVLVIGTGTIGKPLVGLLEKKRQELGIAGIAVHKRTPQSHTVAAVKRMISRGTQLVIDLEATTKFEEFGLVHSMTLPEALAWADVVVDCTPAGNLHKTGQKKDKKTGQVTQCDPWYPPYESRIRRFIAQGSEEEFGVPHALGINDDAVVDQQYVQVVSCNTHNLRVVIDTFLMMGVKIRRARCVLIRRCTDISQAEAIASPTVDPHKLGRFGTHHAYDAHRVFGTRGIDLGILSSSLQIPSQYMHVLHFNIELEGTMPSRNEVINAFRERPLVAVTEIMNSAQIFSEARDQGFNGRFLEQTVMPLKTIEILGHDVVGFCFTPQDGNSLLTTAADTVSALHPITWRERMKCLDRYRFGTI